MHIRTFPFVAAVLALAGLGGPVRCTARISPLRIRGSPAAGVGAHLAAPGRAALQCQRSDPRHQSAQEGVGMKDVDEMPTFERTMALVGARSRSKYLTAAGVETCQSYFP